jgi:ParB/RepB/Spo0J family partition protein
MINVNPTSIRVDHANNPRKNYDATSLQALEDSIRHLGILQPILVTQKDDEYHIVAGYRRLVCAISLGLDTIPIHICAKTINTDAAALVENLVRENLSPTEEAEAIFFLTNTHTIQQISSLCGKSEQWCRDRLVILELPRETREKVSTGHINLNSVKTLARIAKDDHVMCDLVATEITTNPESAKTLLQDADWLIQRVTREHKVGIPVPGWITNLQGTLEDLNITDQALIEKIQSSCLKSVRLTNEDAVLANSLDSLIRSNDDDEPTGVVTDTRLITSLLDGAITRSLQALQPAHTIRIAESTTSEPEVKAAALRNNLKLGADLAGGLESVEIDAEQMRLIARLVISNHADQIAGRGIRLISHDYHTNSATTTQYLPTEEAGPKMLDWICRPDDPTMIMGRLTQALLAAQNADQDAIAKTKRVYWEHPMTHDAHVKSRLDELATRAAITTTNLATKPAPQIIIEDGIAIV